MEKLLAIVVLSYNRPLQLRRILSYFSEITLSCDMVELVVKDDHSPYLSQISDEIARYQLRAQLPVRLHVNARNMGYDANLLDSFNIVDSRYVYLLSDDDYIVPARLPQLVENLLENNHSVFFSPYIDKGRIARAKKYDPCGAPSKLIYDSILFSGIIFNAGAVRGLSYDQDFLCGCIYSQVYLAFVLAYRERAFGIAPLGILHVGGDGINYFGMTPGNIQNDLADRSAVFSDLLYQQKLLKVVRKVAITVDLSIWKIFLAEYSLRLIGYSFRVRTFGISAYSSYLRVLLGLAGGLPLFPVLASLFVIAIPSKLSSRIYEFGVNHLRK